ncbi:hypothetical protein [Priestia megaterium]|uniref:hypothetical protein n=1 Tax=Priestia megaterium TaxID=1404 RepID=UPI003012D7A5
MGVTKVKYDPNRNSYRGPDGRFMSESDVTKLGDAVEVETVCKVDEPVKAEWVSGRQIQKNTKGTGNGMDNSGKCNLDPTIRGGM